MIILTPFQVSSLITAFVSLFLGLFVFFGGEKTKLNFSWLLTSISISAWSLGLFGVVFSTNEASAWMWQYVLDIGGICVPLLYFNFLLYLTKNEKKLIKIQIFSFIAGVILIALNFTNLFKTGVSPKFGINYWINPGELYFLFPLYFVFLASLIMYVTIKEYRYAADKDYKRQIMYVLVAQIFGFGGGLTDFLPQLFHIYPFGNYFIILYAIFISWAALKHHLFDMRVIATELFTFALWIVLLIKVFFSAGAQDFFINVSLLLAVVFFGTMMIRAVIREVGQRERLEKLTKEIAAAYEVEKKAHEVEKKSREELEELDKAKNQFLLAIQHHLRTPLTSMMGYSDLILSGSYGKQSKKILDVIKRFQVSTNGLIKMVNEFLDITQFQLGKKVVLLNADVNMGSMVQEIIEDLKLQADQKGIYLKFEKEKDLHIIKVDEGKIKAALFNIIDNAMKYTQKGGVDIKVENHSPNIKIIIKDTGIGMSAESVASLFTKTFQRGEEAKKCL